MRKASNKTQLQMANACGVCKRTWISYEQGAGNISTPQLIAVSIYCCIDIASLLADFMPEAKVSKMKLSSKLQKATINEKI